MTTAIELFDLQVIKNNRIILDVPHFQIHKGQVLGIMGPNGAGKSILLKVLCLLEAPARGTINFLGETVNPGLGPIHLRRQLAAVFQEPLLLDTTVWDNVSLGLKLRGTPRPQLQDQVSYWLNKLNIEHLARQHARTLSGGEAQRASIARALVLEPEVLLLDEPLASLDAPTKASLLEELADILHSLEMTTVFVTHDYMELPFLAHRAAIIDRGKIIQEGPALEVINNPNSANVASLVGVDNILPVQVGAGAQEEMEVQIKGTGTKLFGIARQPVGKEAYALLRSDEIDLDALPGPQWNAVEGIIKRTTPQGAHIKLSLDCGFPLNVAIPQKKYFLKKYRIGDSVTAVFDPARLQIVNK